ncbi:MAG: 4Fe-4S dicluster domain-containing protein, partial [Candidatus Bathyarchaeia archaeon]
MKRIIANQEACMGCGLCEVYCIVQHSKSKDVVKAYNSERPKPISRVTVELNKPVSFAIQCRHCEDAPCVTACLSGAMQKDEKTGLVTHDKE